MGVSNVQDEYWAELQTIRTHAYYLALYQEQSESFERWINITLAVASSSSIAAWAIWKDHAFVWSVFIALTQLLSVAYKFLPFKSRIKPLSSASIEMSVLADEAEKEWYRVSNGDFSGGEVNDKRFSLRKRSSKIMSNFSTVSLPKSERLLAKAKNETVTYLSGIYGE
ncbi:MULTISPECIES: hypothetical protein [Pseudomonas]|uniref:hypothetical protein n=1 Tax=Pseudomonas TaxID=286 RepID=UPI000B34AB6F|nr:MULTISPECIES: hypothetical protein [Pseudomonas]PMY71018.1 propanediol dehydratase small subunit PduE [Pseudomonas sp. FW305-25]PMY75547.1 propanediol dehydratase small subunit PduE [Pseudomonas sp. FW126-L8]PNA81431.1 propanediol dehydratase small subunit PduE [Pseudomonas sp. FW305-76]